MCCIIKEIEDKNSLYCEHRFSKNNFCDNLPVYWYELNSCITFRCEEHKFTLASKVYSKGTLESVNVDELNKIQKQIDDRMKKLGISDIPKYNKDTTELAWELRTMPPKKFKKFIKKIKNPDKKQRLEDAYYSINVFHQKDPIETMILKRIMLSHAVSDIAKIGTTIDSRLDTYEPEKLNRPITKEDVQDISPFTKDEEKRLLKLNLTIREFWQIITNVITDRITSTNTDGYNKVREVMAECPKCFEILESPNKSKAERKKLLWEHAQKDHQDITKKIKLSGGELDVVDKNSNKVITPSLKLFEKMRRNPIPLEFTEEEAEKIYKKHLEVYFNTISDEKGEASEDKMNFYAELVEKEMLGVFDVNDFLNELKLGTKMMELFDVPLFPITFSFHKAVLMEMENRKDPDYFVPLYKRMMEIDFLEGKDINEKIEILKSYVQKEYPALKKTFDEIGKMDTGKTISKIVNSRLSKNEKERSLIRFLQENKFYSDKSDEDRKKFITELMTQFKSETKNDKEIKTKKHSPRQRREYTTYYEFQQFLKENEIKNYTDWVNYTRFHKLPDNIPPHPDGYYRRKGDWSGWTRAVGKKRKEPLTKDKLDEILDHILENWDTFAYLKDAVIYHWFDTMGLFGTKDPLKRAFFQNFIEWRDIEDGMKALKSWLVDRDFEKPKYGFSLAEKINETEEEYRSRTYTASRVDNVALFRTKTKTVTDIFEDSRTFDPVDFQKNPELFNLFVNIINSELWGSYFDDPEQVLHERMNGEHFHDTVVAKFRKEFEKVKKLDYKKGQYRGKPPTKLQKYGVYRALQKSGFLNMYGTGSGKTKIGFMLAKAMEARKVFWVAPKSVLKQTDDMCLEDYPTSKTTNVLDNDDDRTIPDTFLEKVKSKNITKFHFINYDRFAYDKLANPLLEQLKDQKIDLIVLDEAQRVKNRRNENNINEREFNASKTRQSILKLIKQLRKINPKLKVLMLSATPVVNNVSEAVSIWEILTDSTLEISSQTNIKNAMKIYIEFLPYSVRYEPKYNVDIIQTPIVCEGYLPDSMSDETKNSLSFLEVEQYLTESRIPKMVEKAKQIMKEDPEARILIYSDMKKGIVDKIGEAFTDHPEFRVGYFTGDDKKGMVEDMGTINGKRKFRNPFIKGDVNVLIATRAIAVGVDGIQKVCNHIFFNGLVWTWADFEQIRGRLVRTGHFKKKVFVDLFFATLDGYPYDLNMKYKRIIRKKGLGELIKDGRLAKEIATGVSDQERKEAIKQMIKNRNSGFPSKEELQRKHAQIAQVEIAKQVDEISEDFPTEELFGVYKHG